MPASHRFYVPAEKLILGHAGLVGEFAVKKNPAACNQKSSENANDKQNMGREKEEYNAEGGEEARGCRRKKRTAPLRPKKTPDGNGTRFKSHNRNPIMTFESSTWAIQKP